jgi:hypothetical protein
MPSAATTSETRSLKNWVPVSLCIWSQTLNLGNTSCTNDTDTERCSLVGRLGLSVFDISLGIASIA